MKNSSQETHSLKNLFLDNPIMQLHPFLVKSFLLLSCGHKKLLSTGPINMKFHSYHCEPWTTSPRPCTSSPLLPPATWGSQGSSFSTADFAGCRPWSWDRRRKDAPIARRSGRSSRRLQGDARSEKTSHAGFQIAKIRFKFLLHWSRLCF